VHCQLPCAGSTKSHCSLIFGWAASVSGVRQDFHEKNLMALSQRLHRSGGIRTMRLA